MKKKRKPRTTNEEWKKKRCYKVEWPKNMSRTLISKALFLIPPLRSFLSSLVENSYIIIYNIQIIN